MRWKRHLSRYSPLLAAQTRIDSSPLQAAKLLKVADDGAPYPAPAGTRRNAGVVYSAAAEVLTYEDRLLDSKPPVVTYKPALKHTTWEFPANAKGAKAAAKPTVSSLMSDAGATNC